MSYTHDLVAEEEWRGARLLDLAGRQLSHFIEPVPPRVELDGPELLIAPAAAQQLGLALHELGANAVEHGSLKTLQGKVSFQWRLEGTLSAQPWLHLHWRELNGPPAKPPQRKKFGTLVLERLVPDGLAGSATLSFEEPRLAWTCEMPSIRSS